MQRISLKLADPLYQDLELKAHDEGLSLSDTMRKCLRIGLKHFNADVPALIPLDKSNYQLQKRMAVHVLFTHSLIEHFIKGTVENGEQLCDLAESKAEKMVITMLESSRKGS